MRDGEGDEVEAFGPYGAGHGGLFGHRGIVARGPSIDAPRGYKGRTTRAAVILGLTGVAGYVDPFLGLLVLILGLGLGLLWSSDAWTRSTKLLATALVVLDPLAFVLFGVSGRMGPIEVLVLLAAGVALPVAAAIRLIRTARPTRTP